MVFFSNPTHRTGQVNSSHPARSAATVPEYKPPKRPQILSDYKKGIEGGAKTDRVKKFEETRESLRGPGKEMKEICFELGKAQRSMVAVGKTIKELKKKRQEHETSIRALTLHNGIPDKAWELAKLEKELLERERTIKTEIGFDKLVGDKEHKVKEKKDLVEEKASLEEDQSTLRQEIEDLEVLLPKAEKEKSLLTAQQEDLLSQKVDVEKQLANLTDPIKELEGKLDKLLPQQEENESRKKYLAKRIKDYKNEERLLHGSKSRHSNAVHRDSSNLSLNDKMALRTGQLKDVDALLEELVKDIRSCDDELDPILEKRTGLEREERGINRKLDACRTKIKAKEKEISGAETTLKEKEVALVQCEKELNLVYDLLADVCEKLEVLGVKFDGLNNGLLKEVNEGLVSVKAQYEKYAILPKEQRVMQRTLKEIDGYKVKVGARQFEIDAQTRRFDELQKDADARQEALGPIEVTMQGILDAMHEIADGMQKELDARRRPANRRIEGGTDGAAKEYSTYSPADYYESSWRTNGLVQYITGSGKTSPAIIDAVNAAVRELNDNQCYVTLGEYTYMVYGPNQVGELRLSLPDGTLFSVPAGSPYYYSCEIDQNDRNFLDGYLSQGAAGDAYTSAPNAASDAQSGGASKSGDGRSAPPRGSRGASSKEEKKYYHEDSDTSSDEEVRSRKARGKKPSSGGIPRSRTEGFPSSNRRRASQPKRSYTDNFYSGNGERSRAEEHDRSYFGEEYANRRPQEYPEDVPHGFGGTRDVPPGFDGTRDVPPRPKNPFAEEQERPKFRGERPNVFNYQYKGDEPPKEPEGPNPPPPPPPPEEDRDGKIFLGKKVQPMAWAKEPIKLDYTKATNTVGDETLAQAQKRQFQNEVVLPLKNSGWTAEQFQMLKASLLYIKTQAIADLDKIPKTAKIDDLFNEFVEGEAKKLKPIRSEDDMEDSERKNLYEKMDHDILLKIEHKLRADKRAEVAREHADDSMDEQNRLLGVFELNMSLYFGIKRDGSNKGSAEFGGLKADRKAIKLEDEAKLQFDKLFEAAKNDASCQLTNEERDEYRNKEFASLNEDARNKVGNLSTKLQFANQLLHRLYENVFDPGLMKAFEDNDVRSRLTKCFVQLSA